MPSELEELVEFLHHGNTQIRQTATEHLTTYSTSQPSIFKKPNLKPIQDLKLLVKDYQPIARSALTCLINLSSDSGVLAELDGDPAFLETLLGKLISPKSSNADLITMLLANMAKGESLGRITALKRAEVQGMTPSSDGALDQLLDLFVRGAEGTYNKNANFDYLAYLFADLAKTSDGQKYFVTERKYDRVVPLTKLIVFTEHGSLIRRKGVASTVKNITFHVPSHRVLLSRTSINVLPYILLPLAGPEELSDEDTEALLPELQLLAPDKERDKDHEILKTHLETLLLFSTTREGREVLRAAGVYPIVREAHLHVTEEGVREAAERLVDLLMRDEEGEGKEGQEGQEGRSRAEEVEDDEDEQIVDVF